MIDRERILGKIDELDMYLGELKEVLPSSYKQYQAVEKKRSCERLLQLCIETVLDVCRLFVSGLKLGLPSEENGIFDKLFKKRIISSGMMQTLAEMKGFRNVLIHEYARVDDELVYEMAATRLVDFVDFKKEILRALKKNAKSIE